MKRLIPVIIIFTLLMTGCNILPFGNNNQPVEDAEMATRVAELLATMTTPTAEIVFPPTATATLPAPTATQKPPEPTATTSEAMPTQTPVIAQETSNASETTVPTVAATLPAGDPAAKLGTPTGDDPMDSYEKWVWPTGSDNFLTVAFKDGYMEMTGLTDLAGWRLPMLAQQSNAYIELTVNSGACKEKDSYGIIFRIPVFKEPTQGYLYEVTCDGYLRLWMWNGNVKPNGKAAVLINWKQSTDLKSGANQSNRLGVLADGKTFKVYANGVLQGEVTDTTFPDGYFGVFVRSGTSTKYMVKFDEMKYWALQTQ